MSLYKHSKLFTPVKKNNVSTCIVHQLDQQKYVHLPSEKLATDETVFNTVSNNGGQGTLSPNTMLTICKCDSTMRLMVECNDLRRRWASNDRKERIRSVFSMINKINITSTATATMTDLPPLLSELPQETQMDLVVRELPGAQD